MLATRVTRVGKLAAFTVSRAVGLTTWIRDSRWRQRRLLVLCYHGVSLEDEHEWSDLYVSASHLRKRLACLRDGGFQVVPLREGVRALESGTLPSRSVALTFDDGAHDFHAMAYPLLQEFGMHATLYQTTFYCTFQRPVFDTVASYLLWKGMGRTVELPAPIGGALQVPRETALRHTLHRRLRDHVHQAGLSAEAKDDLARGLALQVGVDYDSILRKRLLHLMTPSEVASLDPSLVSVQLHTHRHRTPRDEGLFLREVADNRAALESMRPGDEPLDQFCYPSGDYDRRFLPWLAAAGVRCATTTDRGLAHSRSERLLLPRFTDTMLTPDSVFEAWLSGVAALLPRRRR